MTIRQWSIIQQALAHYAAALEADKSGGWVEFEVWWDQAADGPVPTQEEIEDTVRRLEMDYGRYGRTT